MGKGQPKDRHTPGVNRHTLGVEKQSSEALVNYEPDLDLIYLEKNQRLDWVMVPAGGPGTKTYI